MSEKRSLLGRKGEDLAASFLNQQGYRLLVRNYRQRYGEIDIIARDGACIAFVEVKTTTTAGGTVTATKIEIEDELKAGENEHNEFEGFISSITGDKFVVNGVSVQTGASTIFVGGA